MSVILAVAAGHLHLAALTKTGQLLALSGLRQLHGTVFPNALCRQGRTTSSRPVPRLKAGSCSEWFTLIKVGATHLQGAAVGLRQAHVGDDAI
jgi:hypothetical protein